MVGYPFDKNLPDLGVNRHIESRTDRLKVRGRKKQQAAVKETRVCSSKSLSLMPREGEDLGKDVLFPKT